VSNEKYSLPVIILQKKIILKYIFPDIVEQKLFVFMNVNFSTLATLAYSGFEPGPLRSEVRRVKLLCYRGTSIFHMRQANMIDEISWLLNFQIYSTLIQVFRFTNFSDKIPP
jgi:hypothetical protein